MYAARSDSVVRLFFVAKSLVTANAFSSVAFDGVSTVDADLGPASARGRASVAASSGDAFAGALAPFCLAVQELGERRQVLGNDVHAAGLEPFSSAGSRSRARRAP